MTTEFENQAQLSAWPQHAAAFGESVVYNPLGVTGSAVTAIVTEETSAPIEYDDGEQVVRRANFELLPSVVTSPSMRDTFTRGGEAWAVIEIQRRVPMVVMTCEERQVTRVGQSTSRIQR